MKRRGGEVLAISVDSPADNARVVKEDGLAFPILSDPNRAAVRAYGLAHPGGHVRGEDIAIPTQVLVGTDGRVLWWRSARRVTDRPLPSEVLAAIAERLSPPAAP